MSASETPREGLTAIQWSMKEHTRLQAEADFLWDDLDHFQSHDDFSSTLDAYNDVCDRMGILEGLPVCAFKGHPVVREYETMENVVYQCCYPGCMQRSLVF